VGLNVTVDVMHEEHRPIPGPGLVVTANTIWVLDDTCYTRVPRHQGAHRQAFSADQSLDDHEPVAYRQGGFERDETGNWYLRLIPAHRQEGARGVLSAPVVASSFALPGVLCSQEPLQHWYYPPSPVPSDDELWPGELPFTAFGQWGADKLDLRVFDQDRYWVDRHGVAHEIIDMEQDYVQNVVTMLESRVEEFHAATVQRWIAQSVGDALLGKLNGEIIALGLGVGSVAGVEPATWLESTPLVRALRVRLATS
jgi:hypothetical protein